MRRILAPLAAAAATMALAAPVAAHEEGTRMAAVSPDAFAQVLADARRTEDRARDRWRNPAQTLAFFGVEPDHTVVEYAPGGGWYTRVLAPYVGERGRYIGVNFGPYGGVPEAFGDRLRTFPQTFPASVEEQTGLPAARVGAYLGNAVPGSLDGTVDRALIVRMLHNLVRWDIADTELKAIRRMLKDDGMVGVVQHQAPEGQGYALTDGNRGYLQKSDVIALMGLYGFELVGESFVNANPADTADYPEGVWTLAPSFRLGDQDRARYEAIGESNRMTLLFRKAE